MFIHDPIDDLPCGFTHTVEDGSDVRELESFSYLSRATLQRELFANCNKPFALSTFNVHETIMTLAQTKATFMSSPRFAVLGASKDQTKVGTKVRLSRISTICISKRNIAVDFEVVPDQEQGRYSRSPGM